VGRRYFHHLRELDLCQMRVRDIGGRGLHSFTFWLDVSAFCGIGGAFRG
jgi:hypothetical protein